MSNASQVILTDKGKIDKYKLKQNTTKRELWIQLLQCKVCLEALAAKFE